MREEPLGRRIARLREARQMTQAELAFVMHGTDKAVSKRERGVACPDISSLPKPAAELGATIGGLPSAKAHARSPRRLTALLAAASAGFRSASMRF